MLKTAVIQAAPVLFDKSATVSKLSTLAAEAAGKGAQLVLFPEAFIPAYPRGFTFGMVVGHRSEEGRKLWQRYWQESVEVPGPETEIIANTAAKHKIYLAVGVIEREPGKKGGTLYCTLLYFGPDGTLLGKHRKLKPTGTERLIWGEGDGSTLTVVDTEFGKIGGLICWENYMPLARAALYQKDIEIYLAPTADSRENWQATMRHIACESRCFVLGCNQFVTKDMYPENLECREELEPEPEVMCRGGSVVVSPFGEVLSGPLFDREGILYADLDLTEITRSRLDFDVTGHYARPDVFQFNLRNAPPGEMKHE